MLKWPCWSSFSCLSVVLTPSFGRHLLLTPNFSLSSSTLLLSSQLELFLEFSLSTIISSFFCCHLLSLLLRFCCQQRKPLKSWCCYQQRDYHGCWEWCNLLVCLLLGQGFVQGDLKGSVSLFLSFGLESCQWQYWNISNFLLFACRICGKSINSVWHLNEVSCLC